MTNDSTFEFERKRNRPERYDRNVAEGALQAIKKIDKIRVAREARHHATSFLCNCFLSIWFFYLRNCMIFPLLHMVSHTNFGVFHRMKGKKEIEQKAAMKELEQSIHMVKAPLALQQEPSLTLPKTELSVSQPLAEENRMEE